MSARNARHPLETLPGVSEAVWATVTQLGRAHTPARLAIVAPHARAGTTTVAAALALALARHERLPVCLVETGVESSTLAGCFGLRTNGLSDVLDERVRLFDAVQTVPSCTDLSVLTGGTPRPAPPGELSSDRVREILDLLGTRCRYLVIDAPPILGQLESRPLIAYAHGSVLVLHAGVTTRADAQQAQRVLADTGSTLLGAVFHAREERRASTLIRNGLSFLARIRPREHAVQQPVAQQPVALNGLAALAPAPVVNAMSDAEREREDAAHRREVELLERRLKKLTDLLAQTEENLQHVLSSKVVDDGVASVYRNVQGLSSDDGAHSSKRALLQEIFLANQDLQKAIAQRA